MILPRALTLVETSAWIETMRPRGDQRVREQVSELLRERRAAWCEMIRLELWNGAFAKGMRDLEELSPNVILLETTAQVWSLAEGLSRKARGRGMTVPATDLLIAACARFHGAGLLHKDRHFDQLKAL